MNFVVGFIFILCGIALIKYRYKVYNFTGEWSWARRYVGGTVNAIVLIGVILIFFGVGYPFGVFDSFTSKPTVEQVSPFGKN